MQGATLATTFTGMRFTKGTLITESHCFMTQNTSVPPALSESIEIGNGNPADEMTVIIGPSSILELLAGTLFYNQVE